MRARGTTAAVLALGLAQALASCRLVDGLGDFRFSGGTGGGGGAGGNRSNGSTSSDVSTGTEDCTNGVDDNGDGRIDCADPGCAAAGYTCVGAVPSGWSGPLAFHEGPASAVPECSDPYPKATFQGGSTPEGAAATCDACACAPPSSACSGVDVQVYGTSSCSFGMGKVTLSPGACKQLPQGVRSLKAGSSTPAASPCSPGGGAAHTPPITWGSVMIACGGAALGGGCAGGELCAPPAPQSFGAGTCIAAAGDLSCPAAYPQKHALVTVDDQRGCSPCACDALACDSKTELFSDGSCRSAMGAPITDGSCTSTMGATAARTTPTARCPPSGGAPSGALGTAPWTICCAP